MNALFVAEIKEISPFGYVSRYSFKELTAVAIEHGDIISCHTDARWGGRWDTLRKVRGMTHKPILAKGIHAADNDLEKALRCGADKVLVVGRIPDESFWPYIWLELTSMQQLPQFIEKLPLEVPFVCNARNLDDGGRSNLKWETIRNTAPDKFMVQASLVSSLKDVMPDAQAVIIGENMIPFAKELNTYQNHP